MDSGWCLEIKGFVNRLVWKAGRKPARVTSKKLAELGGGYYLLQLGGGGGGLCGG